MCLASRSTSASPQACLPIDGRAYFEDIPPDGGRTRGSLEEAFWHQASRNAQTHRRSYAYVCLGTVLYCNRELFPNKRRQRFACVSACFCKFGDKMFPPMSLVPSLHPGECFRNEIRRTYPQRSPLCFGSCGRSTLCHAYLCATCRVVAHWCRNGYG